MYKAMSPGNIGHSVSFVDVAELCVKHGYEGYWFDIVRDSAVPVEKTKDLLLQTGLKPAGFGMPVEFRADEATFESDLSKLGDYVRYASEIGAKRSMTWVLPSSEKYTYEENFELHRSRLKKCCEIMDEYGVLFGLEFVGHPKLRKNVKNEFIYNLDQALDLCKAIGLKNCGIVLDVFHWDLAGQTREDFKKITNEQIAAAHIMDAPEDSILYDPKDFSRRLPGETGNLRIAEFFDGLKAIGYDGPVVVEPFEKKLAAMTFEQALEAVMISINRVWPE